MNAKVTTDDQTFQQLTQLGEVQVMDSHGVPVVLMTLDARQKLQQATYDDGELTEREMMVQGTESLADPQEWGHPDMDVYDTMEGTDPNTHAGS